jgi:predicted Na+-dependent transporter
MRQFGERLNLFFGSNMIYFMLASMLLGWLYNDFYCNFRNAVPLMFGFMTFITAIKTSWKDLKGIFASPMPLLSIILIQHLLMPIFASLLGHLGFSGNQALITGFILASALPVGITAVIWAGMSNGDVALSLTSATLDTLLSPVTVSFVLWLFVGRAVAVDYPAIMGDLLKMIVIPSILGLTIHDLTSGKFHRHLIPFLGPVSSICLCGVIVVNVATAKATAVAMVNAAPALLLLVFLQVCAGFALGWLIAAGQKFSQEAKITCVFSIGIRNTSCGLVIALGHLPTEASIPLLIAMFFQQPVAALSQRLLLGQNLNKRQSSW